MDDSLLWHNDEASKCRVDEILWLTSGHSLIMLYCKTIQSYCDLLDACLMLRVLPTKAKVMSPNGDMSGRGGGLPIWNGRSQDPMEWDNYRYKIQSYCDLLDACLLLRVLPTTANS